MARGGWLFWVLAVLPVAACSSSLLTGNDAAGGSGNGARPAAASGDAAARNGTDPGRGAGGTAGSADADAAEEGGAAGASTHEAGGMGGSAAAGGSKGGVVTNGGKSSTVAEGGSDGDFETGLSGCLDVPNQGGDGGEGGASAYPENFFGPIPASLVGTWDFSSLWSLDQDEVVINADGTGSVTTDWNDGDRQHITFYEGSFEVGETQLTLHATGGSHYDSSFSIKTGFHQNSWWLPQATLVFGYRYVSTYQKLWLSMATCEQPLPFVRR